MKEKVNERGHPLLDFCIPICPELSQFKQTFSASVAGSYFYQMIGWIISECMKTKQHSLINKLLTE